MQFGNMAIIDSSIPGKEFSILTLEKTTDIFAPKVTKQFHTIEDVT